MQTTTRTYTKTDIRRVFENFQADLEMLAYRTQAMDFSNACDYAHDIRLMAEADCLSNIHIQLYDEHGIKIKAHEYNIKEDISWESQRPGANKWPCKPNGELCVLISYSDPNKANVLKQSGKLKISWSPSDLSTNYSNMRSDTDRYYSSNGYGLERNSYTI